MRRRRYSLPDNGFSAIQAHSTDLFCIQQTYSVFNRPILSATGGGRQVCGGWHAKEVLGRGDLDREESGDPPGHCIDGEPPIGGAGTLPPISGGAPGNGVFPASSTSKPCQMAKPGYFSAVAPVFARGHHRGFSMRVSVRPLTLQVVRVSRSLHGQHPGIRMEDAVFLAIHAPRESPCRERFIRSGHGLKTNKLVASLLNRR